MALPSVQLADVNVLIDAAQSIYRAWSGAVPPRPGVSSQEPPSVEGELEGALSQSDAVLRRRLAEQARQGVLMDRAAGKSLSDSVSTPPPPPWVREALLAHPDGSVRELAQAAQDGTLLVTTYTLSAAQAITSRRPISYDDPELPAGRMSVADAVSVLAALTHGGHLVSAPADLAEVIADGKLDSVLDDVKVHAGEHLAAFLRQDPYWRTPKEVSAAADGAKPAGRSWREHRSRNPDAYGVDGDDLYVLAQAREIAARVGVRVVVTTSDYHLSMAAARIGIPSRLYSRDRVRGVHGIDISPRSITPRNKVTVPVRSPAPPPTPGMLTARR